MKGWSPFKQNEHNPIRPKERSERVYVGPQPTIIKDGKEVPNPNYQEGDEYRMSDKPMYEGHYHSSHLMADDGGTTAWPTLFLIDGVWHDIRNENEDRQKEIAKQQGELYTFDTHDKMVDFARHGNWKNKYE